MSSCPQNLYPVNSELYVGKDADGKPLQFKGIPAYREYLGKLAASGHPCPDVSFTLVPAVMTTAVTPFTGFMEFQPANPREQAKYSAMSPYWVGSDDTQAAFDRGLNKSLSR
jgi:hypothetical protein